MNLLKKNIILLGLVQISNYVFPLMTFPYLSRVLGPTGFGSIALAQSVILYFTFVVDFGFNLSATRRISMYATAGDNEKINKLYSDVIIAKSMLALVSITASTILVNTVTPLEQVKYLVYIGFISIIGTVLFPIWLFQGTQKMTGVVFSSTVAKIISLCLVFLLVKESSDLPQAMFASSLGSLASGLIATYYVRKNKVAQFTHIDIQGVVSSLKESFPLFLSFVASSIYTTMNTFILSFFVPIKAIGIYSAADKLKAVSQSAISPVQQAIFPKLASHINERAVYLKYMKKYGAIFFGIGLSISIFLALFSKPIIHLLLGPKFDQSFEALLYMSPLPAIITLAVIFGQWGLVNIGESAKLSKIYIFGGISHLVHVFFMIHFFGIYGAIISTVITESVLTLIMALVFLREVKKYGC